MNALLDAIGWCAEYHRTGRYRHYRYHQAGRGRPSRSPSRRGKPRSRAATFVAPNLDHGCRQYFRRDRHGLSGRGLVVSISRRHWPGIHGLVKSSMELRYDVNMGSLARTARPASRLHFNWRLTAFQIGSHQHNGVTGGNAGTGAANLCDASRRVRRGRRNQYTAAVCSSHRGLHQRFLRAGGAGADPVSYATHPSLGGGVMTHR